MSHDPHPAALARFSLLIGTDPNSGWHCVRLPDSAALFGTGKPVRVSARVNDIPYEATALPVGGGIHMLPLRADLRRRHQLAVGDEVELEVVQWHQLSTAP